MRRAPCLTSGPGGSRRASHGGERRGSSPEPAANRPRRATNTTNSAARGATRRSTIDLRGEPARPGGTAPRVVAADDRPSSPGDHQRLIAYDGGPGRDGIPGSRRNRARANRPLARRLAGATARQTRTPRHESAELIPNADGNGPARDTSSNDRPRPPRDRDSCPPSAGLPPSSRPEDIRLLPTVLTHSSPRGIGLVLVGASPNTSSPATRDRPSPGSCRCCRDRAGTQLVAGFSRRRASYLARPDHRLVQGVVFVIFITQFASGRQRAATNQISNLLSVLHHWAISGTCLRGRGGGPAASRALEPSPAAPARGAPQRRQARR